MAYTTINKSTDYFNTKLYTGTDATQSLTGVGFQPDWVWIKCRSNGNSNFPHILSDAVRGVNKVIKSDTTDAEVTNYSQGYVSAFDSDGFTVTGQDGTSGIGRTYASWNWKAGTTGSGTTGGSGTAKDYQYSVNTTAGFSIIKYKGNGTAGHTIPHHLGAVPKMIIVKCIESTHNWQVLHQGLATNSGTKNLELNSTSAVLTDSTTWNNTAPTSTVFTLGSTNPTNQSSSNYNFIAYCFAEKTGYSKFGSYVGNGSSNGTFIYTGFKPSWIMVKRTDSTSDWLVCDNKRNNYSLAYTQNNFNVVNGKIFPNTNQAEEFFNSFDFLSNGLKIKTSGTGHNASGANMIYMAFGQSLVGSNNVPCTAR